MPFTFASISPTIAFNKTRSHPPALTASGPNQQACHDQPSQDKLNQDKPSSLP
jgi:hypothetical protein